ncbi:MAG: winged helix-turn-helix domain-containing protein [Nitrosarchaeum sp.]
MNEHRRSKQIENESNGISKQNVKKSGRGKRTSHLMERDYPMPDDKITTYISNKKLDSTFEPSLKMIIRIINTIVKEGTRTKTDLSKDSSLNYTRLVKHIMWMEEKGLVKSIVEDSRIKVDLTEKGEDFGKTVAKVIEY